MLEVCKNKKIKSIDGLEPDSDEVIITFDDGYIIKQYHSQDCCEQVMVTQVDSDVNRHIGSIFFNIAEKEVELTASDFPEGYYFDSATATFYTMTTSAGRLDWRWTGESNGYYSESVDMFVIAPEMSDKDDDTPMGANPFMSGRG